MRALALLGLSLLLQPAADLQVQATGGQLRVRARSVPLSRILEQMGRETGMKVVYEIPPPSQVVSAVIETGSEREVLTRLLEGLGVSYAFRLDRSGGRVEMLLITGSGGGPALRSAGSSRPTRPVMPAPEANPEDFSAEVGRDDTEVVEEGPNPYPFDPPELAPPVTPFPPVPEGPRELPRPEFPKGVSFPSLP